MQTSDSMRGNSIRKQPLEVALISSSDPLDVHSFSGTIYHMAQALRSEFPDIDIVRSSRSLWFAPFQKLVTSFTRGRSDPYYWKLLNRWFARRLRQRWYGRRVVVIGVVNAALVSQLAKAVPVINVSDATYDLMRTEHEVFWSLGAAAAFRAEQDEFNSIRRSVHSSFSSSWAAKSAIEHYGAPARNVSVISWGCNFEFVPLKEARQGPFKRDVFRLLFIGGEWERKGGDVVCEVSDRLAELGVKLEVDVVGVRPPDENIRPWLRSHGYLSKANPEHASRLRSMMREADLLFLPTRRDCTPMVFAEANAYGTPALTRAVGGVGDVVRDGINGIVLSENADVSSFVATIQALRHDQVRYARLRQSSRSEYDNRLNWTVWAREMANVVRTLEKDGRI